MNKAQREAVLQKGLSLMKPLIESTTADPLQIMSTVNAVQKHYRAAITPRYCPVCEDSQCEIKDNTCGT